MNIDDWTRSRASGPPTFSCMAISIEAVGGSGLISLASQSTLIGSSGVDAAARGVGGLKGTYSDGR